MYVYVCMYGCMYVCMNVVPIPLNKYSPKQVKELSAFEKDLIAIVKDIKFRNARSDFQTTLQKDIRLIHNSKKTMTFVDKTYLIPTYKRGTQQVITERNYFEI